MRKVLRTKMDVVKLPSNVARLGSDDPLWAVIAWVGKERRIAEVYPSRARALADCDWREREVKAYIHLLRRNGQPVPQYGVAPVRRSDLPRRWRPLPALGFLRGQFV